MKYVGMPSGMWVLYERSFRDHLVSVLGFSKAEAARITADAKPKYREIIAMLPEFEKEDRFKMNIVNCALFASFLLNMKKKPAVEKLTDFYAKAMMNAPTRFFFKLSDKRKFSEKDVTGMKKTAALNAADRNPYSWNMEFLPGSLRLRAAARTATAATKRKKEKDMIKTTLKIDGMMCGMCEAHVCDAIRKAVPKAKKVTASHTKKEASFLTEEPVNAETLKTTIDETGYTCLGVESAPYEKKGWFGRK